MMSSMEIAFPSVSTTLTFSAIGSVLPKGKTLLFKTFQQIFLKRKIVVWILIFIIDIQHDWNPLILY